MYDIRIHVDGITYYIMLESLPIYNLWFSALEVGDFYGTGTVNLLDKVYKGLPTWREAESAFTPKWCFGIMTMWLVGLMAGVKSCISGHWSRGGLLFLEDDWPRYKK